MKRVALLPGDQRYQARNPEGWYDMARITVPHGPRTRGFVRSVPVPAGTLYVLGDNLDVSADSRSFGSVDEEKVIRLVADQREPDASSGAQRPNIRAWLTLGRSMKYRRS